MMKFILLIAVCLIAFNCGTSRAAVCNNNTNCDDCAAQAGCGWCSPTQQCLLGTADGPNSSVCVGSSWNYGSCPSCLSFSSCQQCLDHDTDCVYCAALNNGLGGCRSIGYAGCPGGLSRTCPCGTFSVCSDCVNDGDKCSWCGGLGSCATVNQTCQGTNPVYNLTTGCPCQANKDCHSCNSNGCDWCTEGGCADKGACNQPPIANCNAYCLQTATTCTTCNELKGCAWCAGSKTCVDAVSSPCDYSTTCPVCNAATYCDLCQSVPGCVWCDDARSCEPNTNNTCMKATSCSSYCEEQTGCGACNAVRGCTWCLNSLTCEDIGSVSDCTSSPNCLSPIGPPSSSGSPSSTPTSKRFDGGAFVGGMFLVIGIIVLAAVGYFVYRWKTGKKMDYRQI